MKRNRLIVNFWMAITMLAIIQGCESEDNVEVYTDFASVGSSYNEASGTGIVNIPLRNADTDLNNFNVTFAGTAVEGSDFELVSLTAEGLQIRVLDDNALEPLEFVRITLAPANGNLAGNAIHTLNILSNCEDTENPYIEYFEGDWDATEQYGPEPTDWWGPYTIHLVQDEEDSNKFHFDNLYASGCEAYMIFDLAAGTVYFPDQAPCDSPLTNSSGTFSIDECNGSTLTINLNFDGGDWVYSFTKL
jgi:hypothetical protein